jgi:hypothetical protein
LFLVDLAAPYHLGSRASLGPRLQIGVDNNRTYLAPTASMEYAHDLSSVISGGFGKIRPLIGAGIGFAWLEKEGRRGKNDEVEFLVDLNVGAEYPLTDGFALAAVMDFNVIPNEVLGERLIYSWQVIQLRVQF